MQIERDSRGQARRIVNTDEVPVAAFVEDFDWIDDPELLPAILSALPQIVLIGYDRAGRHLFVWGDCSLLAGMGLAADQLLGRTLVDLFGPAEGERHLAPIRQVLDGGLPHHDLQARSTPGGTRWFQSTMLRVRRGPDEEPIAIAAIRDVTEARALEERAQLAVRHESLVAMARGMAHDFNNLLQAMAGQVSLLRRECASDSARQRCERLAGVIGRAGELVALLQTYAGGSHPTKVRLALAPLVAEVLDLARASAPAGCTLVLAEGGPDLPPISGDPTQLRQVLLNVLLNALEALGAGPGQVEVRLHQLAEPPAPRSTLRAGPVAHGEPAGALTGPLAAVSVRDTGCGMSAEVRGRIGEPYFSTKRAGRGLGLASALGALRGHGGGLQIDSAPGAGSTVTILLPLA